jgi:hypothetical protein
LGLHPSGEPRPSPVPQGALGDSGREKSGDGPALSAREHANPTIWSQIPLSSPRCSVAAGTTPHQSVGRLPELRRPSSHQPQLAYILPYGMPSGYIPLSGNSSRRASSTHPACVRPFAWSNMDSNDEEEQMFAEIL